MIMARLMREEIGDASLLLCGAPLWAPVGLADAVRIGRDIGVTWQGHYSAESLLRDQTSRNFGNGILWQADPDCILLRDRFHDLTDAQVQSLALFAGLAGGVLMTSDHLDEVPAERLELLTRLLDDGKPFACDFPLAGTLPLTHGLGTAPNGKPAMTTTADPVIVQRLYRGRKRSSTSSIRERTRPTAWFPGALRDKMAPARCMRMGSNWREERRGCR